MALRFLKIILPLFCLLAKAQNSGTISYNVVSIDTISFKKNSKFVTSLSQIDEAYMKNNFVRLEFNDSLAKIIKNEKKTDLGLLFYENFYLGSQTEKYYDNNKKSIVYPSEQNPNITDKDEFLIYRDYSNEWNLTKETKLIDGRLCYKAYLEETRKDKKVYITAWYDPEIPLGYGPKGYGGLPGLIIELSDYFCTIRLSKITFADMPIKIELPNKGKKISYQDYNKIIGERMNQLSKEVEKHMKESK